MSQPEQLSFPQPPILIGIAGCSGSGKTTLARELSTQLAATLFPLDLYYRDLSHFPLDQRHQRNFDHPDSLESELFTAHLQQLAQGLPIKRPIYDFKTHSRVPDASKVALMNLAARLIHGGFTLLDTQFVTAHLRQFGAIEVERDAFHGLLDAALQIKADFTRLDPAAAPDAVIDILERAAAPPA